MADIYSPVEGTADDVISTDSDVVKSELNIVNFDLTTNSGTYSRENKITNYINNIFKAYDEAKDYFTECKNIASTYQDKVEIVVAPESPVEPSVFDQYIEQTATVNINSGHLNVRSDASASSKIVTQLNKGETIKVIDYDPNSEWTKVEIDGETRYVATKYLNISESNLNKTSTLNNSQSIEGDTSNLNPNPSSLETPTLNMKTEFTVDLVDPHSVLRVRSTPGVKDNNIIGNLKDGTTIKVLDYQQNGWSKVEYNGQTAYVYSKYLK